MTTGALEALVAKLQADQAELKAIVLAMPEAKRWLADREQQRARERLGQLRAAPAAERSKAIMALEAGDLMLAGQTGLPVDGLSPEARAKLWDYLPPHVREKIEISETAPIPRVTLTLAPGLISAGASRQYELADEIEAKLRALGWEQSGSDGPFSLGSFGGRQGDPVHAYGLRIDASGYHERRETFEARCEYDTTLAKNIADGSIAVSVMSDDESRRITYAEQRGTHASPAKTAGLGGLLSSRRR